MRDTAADRAEVWAGIESVLRAMNVDRDVAPETHFVRDLELDSLRRIELAIRVENHFRVRLEPEDETSIETVGDLVAVIGRRAEDPGALG